LTDLEKRKRALEWMAQMAESVVYICRHFDDDPETMKSLVASVETVNDYLKQVQKA
jgi:hypothetical protein